MYHTVFGRLSKFNTVIPVFLIAWHHYDKAQLLKYLRIQIKYEVY